MIDYGAMVADWRLSITNLAVRAYGLVVITLGLLLLPGIEGLFSPHGGMGILFILLMFPVALIVFLYAYCSAAGPISKKTILHNIVILLAAYFSISYLFTHIITR